MQRQHWKRAIAATLASLATAASGTPMLLGQTAESVQNIPAGLANMRSPAEGPIQYLPFAHFNIPFEVDAGSPRPREVHLWVSPDQGRSWLKYASTTPEKRTFEFHAAAEGEYLFAVQTHDGQGESTLAASPPMRILIDTTQPQLQLSVDVNSAGRLVIDYQLSDSHLAEDSIRLAYSVDGQAQWQEVRAANLSRSGTSWSGRSELDMPRCHELDFRITASDLAQNKAEKVVRFSAPRTAAANSGMQLASQRGDAKPTEANRRIVAAPSLSVNSMQPAPQGAVGKRAAAGAQQQQQQPSAGLISSQGAIAWNPSESASSRSTSGWVAGPTGNSRAVDLQPTQRERTQTSDLGRLAATQSGGFEELPAPNALEDVGTNRLPGNELELSESSPSASRTADPSGGRQLPVARREVAGIERAGISSADSAPSLNSDEPAAASSAADAGVMDDTSATSPDGAYHSRSRAFSLDYAVDSLRGAAVADIELWGTEDRGSTWQKWGSDPDRQSPFDVQVGNDGLFGFRMVIIGANGLVSNRPQSGDSADMWINVDTQTPTVNITRALYGEGDKAGMLVIEFTGSDDNMHDRPVTLSFSERPNGPWVTIESGLPRDGKYYWKPDPSLPPQVFLRAQAVDRAGNLHEHRLELPVSLRGMAPQGRIQGFRPIEAK